MDATNAQVELKMQKKAVRKEALGRRRGMTTAQRVAESKTIAERLLASEAFQQVKSVFVYVSTEDEVHTGELLQACLKSGKLLSVPFITDAKAGLMIAARLNNLDALEPGVFDILTVSKNNLEEILPENIDLVIVPGAAFDSKRHRIGMGGGYYDRFLKLCRKAKRIALAYDCQIYTALPVENHDQGIDAIYTGHHIFK